MSDISNSQDLLDSRDIVERIEELEGEQEAYEQDVSDAEEALADPEEGANLATLEADLWAAKEALKDWLEENTEELTILKKLNDQGEGYGDWGHSETLIREDYFAEYAEELVKDLFDLREVPSFVVIDWDATAENLKIDYTTIDFDGVTYYMRA